MKPQALLSTLFFAACMMIAGNVSASISGFVSSPTTNSGDWGSAVANLGATINANVNFDSIPINTALSPTVGASYALTDGVTFSGNIFLSSPISSDGLSSNPNRSAGEGVWTPSQLLVAGSGPAPFGNPAQSVTFAFQNAVLGGGVFLVDYAGAQTWTISARDSSDNVLGSFQSVSGTSFQQNTTDGAGTHKYFLGISSTEANIASLTVSRAAATPGGDRVGLDDFRFAMAATPPVPEPAEWAMLLAGLGVVGFIARRRKQNIA